MQILLLSDIHLEDEDSYRGLKFYIDIDIKPDIICLCGDIGDPGKFWYKQFLLECANFCNIKTFVVLGNHEHYGRTVDDTEQIVSKICACHSKLVFMNRTRYDMDNIRVLGTTLWSDIDTAEAWNIRCVLSDTRYILNWGIDSACKMYKQNLEWLEKELECAKQDGVDVIVLTHHVPLLSLGSPEYQYSEVRSAFASNLKPLILRYTDQIKVWCYGHDHYSMDEVVEITRVVSNQYGYDQEATKYDRRKIIHI